MTYPLPAYHFQVEWGGTRLGFSEVSGLGAEVQVIEYREGSSPIASPIKVPGLHKYGNVTLRRGIVRNDNEFFDWYKTVKMGTVERRDITISLLDEDHAPVVRWKLARAMPMKIVGPTLDATASEIAIEELVLAHEGLEIENG